MDTKKYVIGVVGVAVMVLLVGTFAIPVISDATAKEDTFTNEGLFRMDKIQSTDTGEYSLKWDHLDPDKITVNDSAIDLPTTGTMTIICSESWLVRYINGESVTVQLFDGTTPNYTASTSNNRDMEITLNAGSVTFDNGSGTSVTSTYNVAYFPSDTGDFVMVNMTTNPAYMTDDSPIFGAGRTDSVFGSTSLTATFEGTIDDGITITPIGTIPDGYSLSDPVINYTDVSNYEGLHKLSSYVFDAVDGDTNTVVKTITYNQFIVPHEVVAERSFHIDGPVANMISVIPVLMVLAIIIGAVTLFIKTRNE